MCYLMNVLIHDAKNLLVCRHYKRFFLQKTLAEHPEYGDFPDGAAVDVAVEQVLVLLRSHKVAVRLD